MLTIVDTVIRNGVVDFIKLIVNNINGIENPVEIGNYDDDVLMLMYDDVVVCKADDLVDRNFKTI